MQHKQLQKMSGQLPTVASFLITYSSKCIGWLSTSVTCTVNTIQSFTGQWGTQMKNGLEKFNYEGCGHYELREKYVYTSYPMQYLVTNSNSSCWTIYHMLSVPQTKISAKPVNRGSHDRPLIHISAALYPPRVIPCGIHGMGGGFHGMVDGFHGMVDEFHTFPHGFHTFFRWIPWSFQMDSMELPDGFHMDWAHGIMILHLSYTNFKVESRWNKLLIT